MRVETLRRANANKCLANRLLAIVRLGMARGPNPRSLRFRMRRRLHPMRLPAHMRPSVGNRPKQCH